MWGNRAQFDFGRVDDDKEDRAPSGAEIACALRGAGCDVRLAGPEHVSLFRDGVEVARLPLGATIGAATLRALLRSLSAEELSEYLLNRFERTRP